MKKKVKRIIGILLSLVLVLSLMPALSLTVVADGAYTALIPGAGDSETDLANKVVHFNGYDWYIIKDESTAVNAGTVTLLAKEPIDTSKFDASSDDYGNSYIKGHLEDMTKPGGSFAGVANAIEGVNLTDVTTHVTGAKLWLLNVDDARVLPDNIRYCGDGVFWWLRTPASTSPEGKSVSLVIGDSGYSYVESSNGLDVFITEAVRPALKLNLAAVTFNSETKTFTPGAYIDYFPNGSDNDDELADKVVKFNGKEWYIIGDNSTAVNAGTVTLFAKDKFCNSEFNSTTNDYKNSTVEKYLRGLTTGAGLFAGVAGAICETALPDVDVTDAKLYLLSTYEAGRLPKEILKSSTEYWWLRSKDKSSTGNSYCVNGENTTNIAGVASNDIYVRPALKLNLAAVVFDSGSKAFTLNLDKKYSAGITGLGTGAITNPTAPSKTTDAWTGNYVYYGKYDGTNPTKYRVLDKASNDFGVTGKSLLLDCDSMLYESSFGSTNVWANSDVKAGLNGISFLDKAGNFTDVEKGAIAESSKQKAVSDDGPGATNQRFTVLSGEKIFLLDAKEATRTSYGYSETANNAANRKKSGSGDIWWLRSPYDSGYGDPYSHAGRVDSTAGIVHCAPVSGEAVTPGVSPALNVSLSSVIFSSLVSGTSGSAGAAYKLTITDPALTIAAGAVQDETDTDKYHISYAITDASATATPTQVSVVVTDGTWSTDGGWSDATKFQYTKLDMDSFALTGTGTFTLDSSFTGTWGSDYHVYVLAEDVNGEKETDYASAPVEITISKPAASVTTAPSAKSLTYTGSAQELVTAGVTTDGTMQYVIGTNTTSAPTDGWSEAIPTATAAGTYYVWYKVKGDADHSDSAPLPLNVTIKSSSGGGYTPSPPSPPKPPTPSTPVEKYTTPAASENSIEVSAEIKDGTATLGEITSEDIKKITDALGDKSENNTLLIDLSGAKSEVNSLEISTATMEVIAKAVEGNENLGSVTIKLSNAEVVLDGQAAAELVKQAKGDSIKLVVEEAKDLSTAQKEALSSYDAVSVFSVYFESDGTRIHDFNGGTVILSVKFEPEDGRDPKHYHVYYLSDLGDMTRHLTRWIKDFLQFLTGHCSDFVIVYDENLENETSKGDDWTKTEYLPNGVTKNEDGSFSFYDPDLGTVPLAEQVLTGGLVHRMYNPNSGEHFYTLFDEERDNLVSAGWNYESEDGFTGPAASEDTLPVYRLYNPNGNDHHFTFDRDEAIGLKKAGWIYEGVAFYAYDPRNGVPVYRVYNPNSGHHFFTADKKEFDLLVSLGWTDEGIAWYAVPE